MMKAKPDAPADESNAAESYPLFFDFAPAREASASPEFLAAMKALNPRHAAFVRFYLESCHGTEAAEKAGYARKHCGQEAHRLLKRDDVRAAIDAARATLADSGIYDLERAMAEAAEGIRFALATGNANAAATLIMHRAKLNGLLIERIAVATVDIASALSDARSRARVPVIEALPYSPQAGRAG
jgi:phage terminase small subunit